MKEILRSTALATADPPLACNLKALTVHQRQEHAKRCKTVVRGVRKRTSLRDGFRYTMPAAQLVAVARWIELERRCCPFLRFRLHLAGDELRLSVTGPEGVKQILAGAIR